MERRDEIHAWAFYGFAQHVFAMNMLSLYFVFWVTKDMRAPDLAYSIALSGSMLLVALVAPAFGAYSDRLGKRTPFVIGLTILCAASTALLALLIPWLGSHALIPALLVFAVANFAFNLAQVFYNAQLPELAPPEKLGWVSGYGMGIGYLGTIVGVLLVMPFVTGKLLFWHLNLKAGGDVGAFVPTAAFFLLFSLPYFFRVRDRLPASTAKLRTPFWPEIGESWRAATKVPGMIRYLIANLLFFDALNTVVGFMGVYAVKVVGLDEQKQEVQLVLMLATLFAIVGSLAWGQMTDRLGAKRALLLDLVVWVLALFAIIFVRNKAVFTFGLAPMVGLAMGGTWTASRAMLSRLCPPENQAQFFGLYSLAGKFAAILGPMTWGLVTYAGRGMPLLKYPLAIASQLIFVLAGLLLLASVPDDRPSILPVPQQP